MARKRRSGVRAQDELTARSEGTVRFGGEHSTLKALMGDAAQNYASDLSAADAAAKSAIHFARKAEPKVRSIFDEARATANTAQQDVQTAFGNVGAGADPFRAATARETALGTQRVAQASAGALSDLQQRQLEAAAGGQYARTAATTKYRDDLESLKTKLSDLGDREGAYVVSRMGALQQSRAGRKAQTRVQRLAARNRSEQSDIDFQRKVELEKVKAGLRDGGGSKGLGGAKPASRTEMRDFQADLAKGLSYATRQHSGGRRRPDAASDLVEGVEGQSPATGPKGEKIPAVSAIPSLGDQLAASVALDMAYDKHISRANARALHKRGLRVEDLAGVTSYGNWKKKTGSSRRSSQYGWGF